MMNCMLQSTPVRLFFGSHGIFANPLIRVLFVELSCWGWVSICMNFSVYAKSADDPCEFKAKAFRLSHPPNMMTAAATALSTTFRLRWCRNGVSSPPVRGVLYILCVIYWIFNFDLCTFLVNYASVRFAGGGLLEFCFLFNKSNYAWQWSFGHIYWVFMWIGEAIETRWGRSIS